MTPPRRTTPLATIAAALALAAPAATHALTFTWFGDGATNDWDESIPAPTRFTNWLTDPTTVPGTGDTVLFGNLFLGSFANGNPDLAADRAVNDLAIDHNAAGTQVILNNSGFTLTLESCNLARLATSQNTQEIRSDLALEAAAALAGIDLSTSASVPEPHTLAALMAGAAYLNRRPRRRNRQHNPPAG